MVTQIRVSRKNPECSGTVTLGRADTKEESWSEPLIDTEGAWDVGGMSYFMSLQALTNTHAENLLYPRSFFPAVSTTRFTMQQRGQSQQSYLTVRIITPHVGGQGVCNSGCPVGTEGKKTITEKKLQLEVITHPA